MSATAWNPVSVYALQGSLFPTQCRTKFMHLWTSFDSRLADTGYPRMGIERFRSYDRWLLNRNSANSCDLSLASHPLHTVLFRMELLIYYVVALGAFISVLTVNLMLRRQQNPLRHITGPRSLSWLFGEISALFRNWANLSLPS
jgi:hypothetical protein